MSTFDTFNLPQYGQNQGVWNQQYQVMSGYDPTQSLQGIDGQMAASGITPNGTGNGQIGSFGNTLGANIPTFQLGLAGLNTVGSLYGAFQANNLAKDQFAYTKKITDTNLANQLKSYNTGLSDKATARGSVEGWSDSQTQDYINKNKL